jgi:hypothetical protein
MLSARQVWWENVTCSSRMDYGWSRVCSTAVAALQFLDMKEQRKSLTVIQSGTEKVWCFFNK